MRAACRIAVVVVSALAGGILALADGPPPGWQPSPAPTPQRVLLIVSPTFHAKELSAFVGRFQAKGAEVFVTAPGNPKFPPEAVGPDVGVMDFTAAMERRDFHKVILAGGGWYPEFFRSDPGTKTTKRVEPPYAKSLFSFLKAVLGARKTLGAYGSGLYPLVLSGAVPPGTPIAAYPCGDLIEAVAMAGLVPRVPGKGGYDAKGRPVTPAQGCFATGSWRLVTMSVPNAWYDPDEGALLMDRYGEALQEFIELLEDAFYAPTTLTPGLVATIEPSGGPFSAEPPSSPPAASVRVGFKPPWTVTDRSTSITLETQGTADADLTGWKVQSVDPKTGAVKSTFTFPDGFVLKAGATVTLRAGQGAVHKPPTDLLWSPSPVASPGSFQFILLDPQGQQWASLRTE